MANDIISIIKSCLSLTVTILCLFLSRYRLEENKKYSSKYSNNVNRLKLRLLLTWLFKGIGILLLFCIVKKRFDPFIVFYIFTPLFIVLHLLFFL